MNRTRSPLLALAIPLACLAAFPLSAGDAAAAAPGEAESALYRAYYLEHAVRDYAGARALYAEALSGDADAATKRAARAGADRCRDQLAARNFATLMPPEALVYLELNRPGQIIEKLAEMLGLTCDDMQAVLARRPGIESPAPIHIPEEFKISPAIFEALGEFGGAALAITDFDVEHGGPPAGVLVLHHGDVKLLKGLVETAFQIAPTAEKIDGLPTFAHPVPPVGTVTGVLTESLIIVGTDRALVKGVVHRLTRPGSPSLASRDDIGDAFGSRPESTLFAYGNLHGLYKRVRASADEHDLRELAMIDALADLDHLRWATFSMGIDAGNLGARLAVRFADDHRSIAYNLLRLPPMSRDCLKRVPPGAAGFFGIGLNPALAQAALDTARPQDAAHTPVTGMDIPREFFGNIREICVFVLPGKAARLENGEGFIPNVGILFAVNDTARSKALWDQILALPGWFGEGEPVEPRRVKIGTTAVTAYSIPEFGKVYMTEFDGCIAFGLTRAALKASLRAERKGRSILDDKVMGRVIARMPRDSSLMLAAHIGRVLEGVAGTGEVEIAAIAGPAAQLCKETVVWIGVGQAPNEFSIQGAIRGLPDLNAVLRQFSPMLNGLVGMMAQRPATHTRIVVRESLPEEAGASAYEARP